MHALWIDVARSGVAQRMATWPWRIGLGWLVGRRFALVSTQTPEGAIRRTLVPAHIVGGDVLLAGLEGAHWQTDVVARNVATVQAHPGPLAARVEPVGDGTDDTVETHWHIARATGAPAPAMVGPDQIWLWGIVPGLAVMWALVGRRTPGRRHRRL